MGFRGDDEWARRARDALLALDAAILLFVVVTSFTAPARWIEIVDTPLRQFISGDG